MAIGPATQARIWKHIYFVSELKFLCFLIPKAANLTIPATLHMNLTGAKTSQKAKCAGRHFGCNGIWTAGQREREFAFTFLRNPFARVLSCYVESIAIDLPRVLTHIFGALDYAVLPSPLRTTLAD